MRHSISITKYPRTLCLGAAAMAACALASCHSDAERQAQETDMQYNRVADADRFDAILNDTTPHNRYLRRLDAMPDDGCVKMRINSIGPLFKVLNDSNYLHYEAAEQLGIEPVCTATDAWRARRPLVRIESCREYYVDNLTHSFPYLVPEAAELVKETGRRFNDSLAARGGGSYRMKVTSVLRTDATVKRLRRVNRNAVDSSAHRFATTFDISYSKFICDSLTVNRTQEDLKNLLAEVLQQLRLEGRCYVKYERKQSCFHITTRPPGNRL